MMRVEKPAGRLWGIDGVKPSSYHPNPASVSQVRSVRRSWRMAAITCSRGTLKVLAPAFGAAQRVLQVQREGPGQPVGLHQPEVLRKIHRAGAQRYVLHG